MYNKMMLINIDTVTATLNIFYPILNSYRDKSKKAMKPSIEEAHGA